MSRDPELAVAQSIRNTLLNYDLDQQLSHGVEEYFQSWGDGGFPWDASGNLVLYPNRYFSQEQKRDLQRLVDDLNVAWKESVEMSRDEFLKSPWPRLIECGVVRCLENY